MNTAEPELMIIEKETEIAKSLNVLFPEQEVEGRYIKEVKNTLGEISSTLSNEELKSVIAEIQFLVDTWLDDFERKIFKGQTLRELLHEKGGL